MPGNKSQENDNRGTQAAVWSAGTKAMKSRKWAPVGSRADNRGGEAAEQTKDDRSRCGGDR